jgi:molybdate transport system ATP-binding protein
MYTLPPALSFIQHHSQTWAIVGDSDSGQSELVRSIGGKLTEHVSFRHHFRNLSHTTDFYYQQRYNSADSEDALTVIDYLMSEHVNGYWDLNAVVQLLRLQSLLDEQVIKLSNGETKRLLIAVALIRNPELIILDHPLTGLDQSTRDHFNDILTSIIQSGISIIIATDPWEIPLAVSHVAVLKDHQVIFKNERKFYNSADFHFIHPPPVDHNLLKHLLSFFQPSTFNTIIHMENVTVEYDGRKILNGINWHVKQSERWAVSGPNGAGKSTLLSLINGDNPQAYANNITLFDRRRGSGESIWDIKKQTGFVSPELFQYFPTDSSCLHVIESGFYDTIGLFRPTDPNKETICIQWMKLLTINKYANTLFSRVPSSVQRLCLLARALVKNPALLILDEPTQGLDSSQQRFFTQLIDDACAISRVTLIFVSHYVQHIPAAVNNFLRLEKGSIIE